MFAVLSCVFGRALPAPGPTPITAFFAVNAVSYLLAFFHCLLRLIYSRWPSWFLFTLGFGALTLSGLAGVVENSHFGSNPMIGAYLELFRLGILPVATVVLLASAYASRARARGHRIGSLKTFFKGFLMLTILGSVWRIGGFELIGRLIGATSVNANLAVEVCSALALGVFIFRVRRLAREEHDEIVAPAGYWAIAVFTGRVLAIFCYLTHQSMWWQITGLELAGIGALLLGLGLANEQTHRQATEKMTELQSMQRVSWSLVGATNLEELTDALVRGMAENFGATAAAVYLAGDTDEELVIAATAGIDDPTVAVGKVCSMRPDRRRGFHSGHTARAFASGEIQLVTDIFSDVEFLPWRTVAQADGIVVSVPLPYRNRQIGVVALYLHGVENISDAQSDLLQSIAAAVSPSIENSRLRSALSQSTEQAA